MFFLVHIPVDIHHTFCPETQAELQTIFIEVPKVLRRKPLPCGGEGEGQLVGEPGLEGGLGAVATEMDGVACAPSSLLERSPKRAYANIFLPKMDPFSLTSPTVYHKGTRTDL